MESSWSRLIQSCRGTSPITHRGPIFETACFVKSRQDVSRRGRYDSLPRHVVTTGTRGQSHNTALTVPPLGFLRRAARSFWSLSRSNLPSLSVSHDDQSTPNQPTLIFSAPTFVYSFETEEHIYFVFQEIAVETSPEVNTRVISLCVFCSVNLSPLDHATCLTQWYVCRHPICPTSPNQYACLSASLLENQSSL